MKTNRNKEERRKELAMFVALAFALAQIGIVTPVRHAQAAPAPQPGAWPFFRYDMQRTNRVPPGVANGNILQPAIKWTYPVGGSSSAWVADITGPNGLPDGLPEVIAYGGGRVRAFNPRAAQALWVSEPIPNLLGLTFVGDVDANGSVEVLARAQSPQGWRLYALAGATGQRLSVINDPNSAAYAPIVVDADGDGRMEVLESNSGDAGDPDRDIYTYMSGAASPQKITTLNLLDNPRMAVTGDANGDGTREVIYTSDGRRVSIVRTDSWEVVSHTLPAFPGVFPTTILTDVILGAGSPGAELLTVWSSGSWDPLQLATLDLHRVGPAPTYAITTVWAITTSNPVAMFSSGAVVANLDGGSDREIVWSYFDNTLQSWVTRIVQGSTGNTLQTIIGEALCAGNLWLPLFAHWKGAATPLAAANLDADAFDEVLLCPRANLDSPAESFKVYDWSGSALSLKWQAGGQPAGWNELASLRPEMTQQQPRFTADFNNDGVQDVLVRQGATLRAHSGIDGAVLAEFTSPVGFGVQYVGGVGAPNQAHVLISSADGYLHYLDNTLQIQTSVYAATGATAPYVVDTNGDGKNEVVMQVSSGALVNLDPYTATQKASPKLNWATRRTMMGFWHPLNVDSAGLWEYPVVDLSQNPTRTVQLLTKDPLSGVESVLASAAFTAGVEIPLLHAVGDFDGSGDGQLELFLSLRSGAAGGDAFAVRRSGASLVRMWPVANTWQANVSRPGAVGDANGDGKDDIAWVHSMVNQLILNGPDGSALGAKTSGKWFEQPMIGNLDGDPTPEVVFASNGDRLFLVAEFTPIFTLAFSRTIPGAMPSLSALADASLSEPGLEILYAAGGVLGAMSGINGNDIYTRALGVAFNTVTCESSINIPASYLGAQLATLEALCPGAGRFLTINDIAVADIDGSDGGRDEILAASENGYLYALNAENGSLLWGYNFYYPVRHIVVANIDNDPQLEILVSVADGFVYALEQQTFARPQSAWDGPSPVLNDDTDVQLSQTCYSGHWRATSDTLKGQPQGYRVALRDASGALLTDGYLDVPHITGATVMGVTLCLGDPNPQRRLISNLIPGQRYFLEVISYKGADASAPTFTDGVVIAQFGTLEGSYKQVSPATTTPGGTLTWQVIVRNDGQSASTAQVLDPIPMNTTYVAGSASATFGSISFNPGQNRIEWSSNAPLAVGQVVTLTFQTQVATGFSGGLIQNTAQIINLDSGLAIMRSATAAVGASNLSSAVKTVDKGQALLGDVLSYTIRLTNTGTLTANGSLLSDPLPAGVSFVAGSLSSAGGSGSAIYDNVLKRVIWNGSLAPGQTLQVQFRAQVNIANGILDNCAVVSDAQNGAFQRCARTVVGSGGPSLIGSLKTSDRFVYSTTDTIVYTVTLVNNGTQATTVQMRDDLPAGVVLQSASVIPNVGLLSYTGSRVTWNGSIAAGDIVRVVIAGTLNRSDSVMVNRAIVTDVTSSRVYTLSREVLVGTTPALDLQKFAEPPSAQASDEITYVIRLENTGNMPAANAVVTDPLPSGTSYVPGSAQASIGAVTYNATAQRLEWAGPVFITAPTFITWRVKVELNALPGFPIVNVARSFDGQSDYDETVALTPINVPPGKALIRAYVFSGTTTLAPMSGVQVSAGGLATVTGSTDANGYVGLLVDALVTPTNYAVFQIAPPGFVNLTPNPVGVVGVTAGGVYEVVFRNAPQAPPGSGWVRGVVFHDVNGDGIRNLFSEAGLANVTVSASDGQTMQTLSDGSFFFLLPAGTRQVTQTNLAGWVSTTPDTVSVNVLSQGAHTVNFGDWLCPTGSPVCDPVSPGYARLYGYVYEDADAALNLPDGMKGPGDAGLPLVEVQANGGAITDTTDSQGLYYMDVPAGLISVILPNPPAGYLSLSPSSVAVNAPDQSYVRVDFAVISSTVCGSGSFGVVNGFVYSDTLEDGQFIIGIDEPTLTEATVTLGSATQRTNWMYAFACVPAGSQDVNSTNPAGYTNTTPNAVSAGVSAAGSVQVDFGKAYQGPPVRLYYVFAPIVTRD